MNQPKQKMPWERRLKDLGYLLQNCASTYLSPDLFRMNTNQFLQTSRTVTFIIQKNKANIKDFDAWYNYNVVETWSKDEVMRWAKDSRNIIEKQGDLEINSSLKVSLVFSYLEDEDINIKIGKKELLEYSVKKLIRYSQKHLPSGISDSGALRISRTWVTTGLSNWELLHALIYVYIQQYEVHIKLCKHLQTPPSLQLIDPSDANILREVAINPEYLKLRDLKSYSTSHQRIMRDNNYQPPAELESKFKELRNNFKKINSIDTALTHFLEFSRIVYTQDEFHISMLHLFDKNWNIVDQTSTVFADQSEKYIFWRSVGNRVKSQNIHAVVWVCEIWHRDMKGYPQKPMRNLRITGEGLMVTILCSSGHYKQGTWGITRNPDGNNPILSAEPEISDETTGNVPYFLAPIGSAMGDKAASLFLKPSK